ncbi:hypothetical protein BN1708_007995, partial [Verticillium longisporum]
PVPQARLVACRWLVHATFKLARQHGRDGSCHVRRHVRCVEDQLREGAPIHHAQGGRFLPQQILVEAIDRVRPRTSGEEEGGWRGKLIDFELVAPWRKCILTARE